MNERRTAKALLACFSFRGHDVFEPGTVGSVRKREAKRITRRARRRHDRSLCVLA